MSFLFRHGSSKSTEKLYVKYLEIAHAGETMQIQMKYKKGRPVLIIDAAQSFKIEIKKRTSENQFEIHPDFKGKN